ncbi:MAG: sulfite exporter TauE/SafE family protein [Crocinitomix sp.]|nr:sulfite exporter TauE/SafE family protein [Crocinitomix sp.]
MIAAAFILGLVGSWHCIGMCGPIALMVPGSKGKNRIYSILLYHGGKILAYLLIGLLFGLLSVFVTSFKVQAIITISVGVLMALIAFLPAILNRIERKGSQFFSPLVRIKNQMAKAMNKNRLEYTFYIGFLNGFIPCGMVYIAALGAIAQPNIIDSMLFMVFFGLGTMPFMSALIFASNFFKQKFGRIAVPLRTFAFCAVGFFMIYRGVSSYQTEISEPRLGESFIVCP